MSKLMKTPKGVAVFPSLVEPDEFQGKREYKTKLRIPKDDPELQALVERLEQIRDEYWADPDVQGEIKPAVRKEMRPHPVYEEELDDNEEPTGFVLINCKCNEGYKTKQGKFVPTPPNLVDAKKQPLGKDVDVWGGSVIRVAFKPVPWAMAATSKYGVKLRMTAVQVIELRHGSDGTDAFEEEDGFEYEGSDEPTADDVPFDTEGDDEDF